MRPRIILIHPYAPSMPSILSEFATGWPEADVLSILDESLYADVTPDGQMRAGMVRRIATLLAHAEASHADAIVFTGSTFGPAVDAARQEFRVPILKADEAMANQAVAHGGPILLVCTAGRAIPVITANLVSAGAAAETIETMVVAEAKVALTEGQTARHDELIAGAIVDRAPEGVVLLGQVSMAGALLLLPPALAERTLISARATVEHLKGTLKVA